MVVGFDVYHDPLRRLRSVGGLVASLDKHMSRYFSAVSHHNIGEELSNDMPLNVCSEYRTPRKNL
jgi:aubergine-like protein